MRALVLSAAVAALIAGSSVAPARAAAPDTSGRRTPADVGTYLTDGDHVRVSSTKPATSAHGWWTKVSGPGPKVRVTI